MFHAFFISKVHEVWHVAMMCLTKSPEQSRLFTARTHRHQNFQTQTTDLSFSADLSLNLCSSIRFVFILFYFFSRDVIRWSILFCKRNSLWTMNYDEMIRLTDTAGEQRRSVLQLQQQQSADVLEQFLLRADHDDNDRLRRHLTWDCSWQSLHRRLRRRRACT